jgi:hypothetical protein
MEAAIHTSSERYLDAVKAQVTLAKQP